MSNSEKYYEERLYPLQNGVLNIVNNVKTSFFLTGGTAHECEAAMRTIAEDIFYGRKNSLYTMPAGG